MPSADGGQTRLFGSGRSDQVDVARLVYRREEADQFMHLAAIIDTNRRLGLPHRAESTSRDRHRHFSIADGEALHLLRQSTHLQK